VASIFKKGYGQRKERVKVDGGMWVDGLAGLVNAKGRLYRILVSSTEELTKGSGSTLTTSFTYQTEVSDDGPPLSTK